MDCINYHYPGWIPRPGYSFTPSEKIKLERIHSESMIALIKLDSENSRINRLVRDLNESISLKKELERYVDTLSAEEESIYIPKKVIYRIESFD